MAICWQLGLHMTIRTACAAGRILTSRRTMATELTSAPAWQARNCRRSRRGPALRLEAPACGRRCAGSCAWLTSSRSGVGPALCRWLPARKRQAAPCALNRFTPCRDEPLAGPLQAPAHGGADRDVQFRGPTIEMALRLGGLAPVAGSGPQIEHPPWRPARGAGAGWEHRT